MRESFPGMSPEAALMRGVLLMASLFTAAGVLAQEPLALFGEMARNIRAVNYQGVFIYEQGQSLSSARIVHSVIDGVERERLEQLDGPPRDFLRLDHPLSCQHEGSRRLGGGAPLDAEGVAALVERLGGSYAFEYEGPERVASRDGRRLRVSPRDPYRYGRTLVLDAQSGLPLRSETTDGAGRVLERFQFVALEVGGAIAMSDVLSTAPGPRIEAAHQTEPGTGEQRHDWSVAWLPDGFGLSAEDSDGGAGRRVESRMYTDGIASFTVFVERGATPLQRPGVATQGATVAYVTSRGDGNLVSVIGSIPVEAAQLIAHSVNMSAPRPD